MTLINFSLEGKGALITGGASGFGKAFALELAKRNAEVVLVDNQEEKLEEAIQILKKKTSHKVIPIRCDVSNATQVEEMAKQLIREAYDHLVNCEEALHRYKRSKLAISYINGDKILEDLSC